jgi:hypothetical protein
MSKKLAARKPQKNKHRNTLKHFFSFLPFWKKISQLAKFSTPEKKSLVRSKKTLIM